MVAAVARRREAVGVEYELVEAGDRVVGLFHQRMRGHYTGIDVASGTM